ncbi:hypothetical protein AMJ86_06765 [bacterium SM23_57]|jgi:uncharacterized protein (DUF58 family)|nr:MAG: hypothetical protein AMJ86_06765 [bacterium SM23_57]
MMKTSNLLSFISFILIFSGLVTLNPHLLGMSIPFILYLFLGLLSFPSEIKLEFQRTLSTERTTPGSPVDISVQVYNRGQRLDELIIEDKLPSGISLENGAPRHLINIKHGEIVTWKYTIKADRGQYYLDTIQVQSRDKFGVKRNTQSFPTNGQLLVLPQMLKLKRLSIRPRKTRVYSGEIPSRSGGLGVEFYGVREYRPGDTHNSINWKASARYPSRMFSNEFEQERVADVGIILDGRERSNIISNGETIFEYSVIAAASLSNAFLLQGDRVGLLHYGKYLQWTFPGYGKYQREKILRALTSVVPGHSLVFSYLQYLPTQLFPPQSQIVLISPLTKDDPEVLLQIRARGYRVLVISPNPIAFECKNLPTNKNTLMARRILTIERELLLRQLVRGGIRVVNWDVSIPFDQIVGKLSQAPVIPRSVETGI